MADQDQFDREPQGATNTSTDVWSDSEHEQRQEVRSNTTTVSPTQSAQAVHGNQLVLEAINALGGNAFTAFLGGQISHDVSELPASFAGDSNTAMLRAMDDDGIDWSAPSLQNLQNRSGRPLNALELARFNASFGRDFSKVRLHTDSIANQAAKELHVVRIR